MPRPKANDLTIILLCALFFTSIGSIAFWQNTLVQLSLQGGSQILFLLSVSVFIFCFINILLSCLLCFPILKPLLFILLGISAAANYFSVNYGVYIDRSMIQNVMGTSLGEAESLLTPSFFLWCLLFGLLPILFFTWIKINPQPLLKKTGLRLLNVILSALILVIVALPLYKEYASFFRNNKEIVKLITPSNYLAALYSYTVQQIEGNKPLIPIGLDAQLAKTAPDKKPKLVIFVVGETARANNFSLFGYERKTNPELEQLQQQEHLLVFQNTSSCGTSTAVSVPCMFSKLTRKEFSTGKASRQENVLDILNRAGVNVYWRENNTGCQGVCLRILSDIISFYHPKTECPDGFCLDENLLDGLDTYIATHQNQNIFIVLHTIGSHGPAYYKRYPKDNAPFTPSCDTNQIQTCTTEQLVNTYDNTITYTDHMLAKTIEYLKQHETNFQTAMVYVSDHGESLGESGIYLHSTPYAIAPEMQTHVPMIVWGSKPFFESSGLDYACLQNTAQNDAYSHDYIFSSILSLMDVKTSEYKAELDIFSKCKIQSSL